MLNLATINERACFARFRPFYATDIKLIAAQPCPGNVGVYRTVSIELDNGKWIVYGLHVRRDMKYGLPQYWPLPIPKERRRDDTPEDEFRFCAQVWEPTQSQLNIDLWLGAVNSTPYNTAECEAIQQGAL